VNGLSLLIGGTPWAVRWIAIGLQLAFHWSARCAAIIMGSR